MIQVETISIEEFRGIRCLELNPNNKSFVVWGPNGSGKSGVVDAIDFALTGNITRLSGTGTGNVSVQQHGPHVLMRDNPEISKVSLTVRDPVSKQAGVLTRCVKTPRTFTLTPNTPQLRAAVDQAREHPELTLSRREIIKYILAEPSDRAKSIQALLKLDRIDKIRGTLMTARTQAEKNSSNADRDRKNAESALSLHLGLADLSSESDVARAINKRRTILELKPIEVLTPGVDLKEGVAPSGGAAFNKESAIRDVQSLADSIAQPDQIREGAGGLAAALSELTAKPGAMGMIQHRSLVEKGLDALTEARCPLCDTEWPDVDGLRAHFQEKLAQSQEAADLEARIRSSAGALQTGLRSLTGKAQTVQSLAARLGDAELPTHLQLWSDDLTRLSGQLETTGGAATARSRVNGDVLALPSAVVTGLVALKTVIEALPDESTKHRARSFLEVAQDRWITVGITRTAHQRARDTSGVAASVYDAYVTAADEELRNLYSMVEADFSSYYRHINAGDESKFEALLQPSAGKLDFQVDFYGKGMFPPAAYHSEGHQDGMGICLYLALARQIFGENFRFAVLDDVVMSVDSSHRRQFCELLKDQFPEVQFIITTHDEVWARQMRSSGLVVGKSEARFYGWSVEEGPVTNPGEQVWDRIDVDLANNEVPEAAHKLRRYLEAMASDICAGLRAHVTYKPDSTYDLGDFTDAANGRYGELLGKVMASASSWKNEEAERRARDLKARRSAALSMYGQENWVINKLVHHNGWAAMVANDFTPVVVAARQFLGLFQCENLDCGSWIHVVGKGKDEESLRCDCGGYNLNLKVKK